MPKIKRKERAKLLHQIIADMKASIGAADAAVAIALVHAQTVRARGKTLEKALAKLLRLGLVEECKAKTPDQSWRQEEGRGVALKITDKGQEALGVDVPPKHAGATRDQADSAEAVPTIASPAASAALTIRPGTKQARLVAMLKRKDGAAIDALVSELGWQAHTVRAAITGLRKKGYVVTSSKGKDGKTVYRASEPVVAADNAA